VSIFLLHAGDDGAVLSLIGERGSPSVQEFLDDPVGTYGIERFVTLPYYLDKPDPCYWPTGTGMLIDGFDIEPIPSGALRLP
jgi:hypothetical protein